jgi:2-iminobutanoate/2-iminopropanoate deaminase
MVDYHNISILDPPASPYSHVVESDGLVCLAGQVAADSPKGRRALGCVARETEVVMEQIGVTLRAHGLSFADVLRVDIHLVDLADMGTVDPIYARYFAAGRLPARTCVEVRRLYGGSRIEVTVLARREPERRATLEEGRADRRPVRRGACA